MKKSKKLKKAKERQNKLSRIKTSTPNYNKKIYLKKNGKAQKINEQKIYEGNFIKNAINKAKNFFQTSIKNIKKNAKKILNDFKKEYMSGKNPSNFLPGKMLAINYRAKDATKRFDKNPLIICLGPPKNKELQKTHTLGLNLHWLPAKDRVTIASFFVELLEKRNGKLRYEDVKPFMYKFKGSPVLRMYIIKNIGPRVIEMPSDVFLTASAIPSEAWVN